MMMWQQRKALHHCNAFLCKLEYRWVPERPQLLCVQCVFYALKKSLFFGLKLHTFNAVEPSTGSTARLQCGQVAYFAQKTLSLSQEI